MLIRRVVLDRIAAGEIDLVFRRWRKPTVRAGGQLRTAVGMLDINGVDQVAVASISVADARRAGYESRAALVRDLRSRPTGDVYRIEVRLGGADPVLARREQASLSSDDLAELSLRLSRLDRVSKRGPWTVALLRVLADNPHVRAQDLADQMGLEKSVLKNDVRKLKALALTISHSPGYELSPRGWVCLSHLESRPR